MGEFAIAFLFIFISVFFAGIFPLTVLPRIAVEKKRMEIESKQGMYPEKANGWKTRLRDCPFTTEEVGEFLTEAVEVYMDVFPDTEVGDVTSAINSAYIWFVQADMSLKLQDKRAVRHIVNENYPSRSSTKFIAGDNDGFDIRVVFNIDDVSSPRWKRLGRTALGHELLHLLDREVIGIIDYNHRPEVYVDMAGRIKRSQL